MIYDSQTLKNKYSTYSNINQKIALETRNKRLTRIKKGIYSDNIQADSLVLANFCYSPSYISFEYALYYYGLIPEYVSVITSACYGKKNNKTYISEAITLEYRSVSKKAFSYGIQFEKNIDGITYKIASKEKALCDILYSKYPVRSIKDLKVMLFEDLRIDEEAFYQLNFDFILEIAPLYHSSTMNTLIKFIMGVKKNASNN